MPGVPWWTVLAGLTEAAKLARAYTQRKMGGTPSAEEPPPSPAPGSDAPLQPGEIHQIRARLRRLEALREDDNQFTAQLGEQLQNLAILLQRVHFQLRASLVLSILALVLALGILLWIVTR